MCDERLQLLSVATNIQPSSQNKSGNPRLQRDSRGSLYSNPATKGLELLTYHHGDVNGANNVSLCNTRIAGSAVEVEEFSLCVPYETTICGILHENFAAIFTA